MHRKHAKTGKVRHAGVPPLLRGTAYLQLEGHHPRRATLPNWFSITMHSATLTIRAGATGTGWFPQRQFWRPSCPRITPLLKLLFAGGKTAPRWKTKLSTSQLLRSFSRVSLHRCCMKLNVTKTINKITSRRHVGAQANVDKRQSNQLADDVLQLKQLPARKIKAKINSIKDQHQPDQHQQDQDEKLMLRAAPRST